MLESEEENWSVYDHRRKQRFYASLREVTCSSPCATMCPLH